MHLCCFPWCHWKLQLLTCSAFWYHKLWHGPGEKWQLKISLHKREVLLITYLSELILLILHYFGHQGGQKSKHNELGTGTLQWTLTWCPQPSFPPLQVMYSLEVQPSGVYTPHVWLEFQPWDTGVSSSQANWANLNWFWDLQFNNRRSGDLFSFVVLEPEIV